ncbi:uncharacterized protein SPPG_01132 [Spizellomyces punctatus DAOM BR117]|uniref:N-acetyltransferase domain-containing protein n=1 Tax=Spizellomyces punctatus (strain DAOM BR117) TaxID=645134 RepID=A0A0L0HRG2_SPIPD|nr:uncharacterized protein SPPG_01132 [Spizellomyces punctatus DAOM BR117]KND03662.1 hypothetical protein SPPG_01132 [Spizellomyces punctatus DAOM BR117]|eukprot:XP_016611701.1 hypothetical protein SPPG_01132 [Spizellomyces punctatus DAOM BR117]
MLLSQPPVEDIHMPGAWYDVVPSRTSDPITLDDGEVLDVRLLSPEDEKALYLFHENLSDRTKFERFHGVILHLSPAQLHYFTHIDQHTRVALIALKPSEPSSTVKTPTIVSVCRYDVIPSDPTVAELAIVVTDAYQGRGLATQMVERLFEYAKQDGIKEIRAAMLHENVRVHSLLKDVAARMGVEVVETRHANADYEEDEVSVILSA